MTIGSWPLCQCLDKIWDKSQPNKISTNFQQWRLPQQTEYLENIKSEIVLIVHFLRYLFDKHLVCFLFADKSSIYFALYFSRGFGVSLRFVAFVIVWIRFFSFIDNLSFRRIFLWIGNQSWFMENEYEGNKYIFDCCFVALCR